MEGASGGESDRHKVTIEYKCPMPGCGLKQTATWPSYELPSGLEGVSVGDTLEGPFHCPDCDERGVAHSGLFEATNVDGEPVNTDFDPRARTDGGIMTGDDAVGGSERFEELARRIRSWGGQHGDDYSSMSDEQKATAAAYHRAADEIEKVLLDGEHPEFVNPASEIQWRQRAIRNIGKWGNQSPGLLFIALLEELGEVAEEMVEESTVRAPKNGEKGPWSEAWRFINDMRRLGLDARDFLESNFDEPGGAPNPEYPADMPVLSPFSDPDAVQSEVDDASPLLFQLTWSLNNDSEDVDTPQEGSE